MNPAAYLEMAEVESRHWWFTARRSILAATIEQLQLPKTSNILEIGCGTGGNLDMLAKFGRVSALEMDSTARSIAEKKTKHIYEIKEGYCPGNIPFANQQFDLICLFDVLEHIENDIEALVAIKKLLNKEGRILITVPAYQWLYGTHDEFLHHKRRYTANELREKIFSAGLKIKRLSYFNTILFPLAAIARLKDKLFPGTSSTGSKIPLESINFVFCKLFGSEKYLLKHINLPYGISLICILEANANR